MPGGSWIPALWHSGEVENPLSFVVSETHRYPLLFPYQVLCTPLSCCSVTGLKDHVLLCIPVPLVLLGGFVNPSMPFLHDRKVWRRSHKRGPLCNVQNQTKIKKNNQTLMQTWFIDKPVSQCSEGRRKKAKNMNWRWALGRVNGQVKIKVKFC